MCTKYVQKVYCTELHYNAMYCITGDRGQHPLGGVPGPTGLSREVSKDGAVHYCIVYFTLLFKVYVNVLC